MTSASESGAEESRPKKRRGASTLRSSLAAARRRPWSEKDLHRLARLHADLGNRWSLIAKSLRGRTDNDVKNIFHSALRSKTNDTDLLLRTYAQAVGPNCDDTHMRQQAFEAARRRQQLLTEGAEAGAEGPAGEEGSRPAPHKPNAPAPGRNSAKDYSRRSSLDGEPDAAAAEALAPGSTADHCTGDPGTPQGASASPSAAAGPSAAGSASCGGVGSGASGLSGSGVGSRGALAAVAEAAAELGEIRSPTPKMAQPAWPPPAAAALPLLAAAVAGPLAVTPSQTSAAGFSGLCAAALAAAPFGQPQQLLPAGAASCWLADAGAGATGALASGPGSAALLSWATLPPPPQQHQLSPPPPPQPRQQQQQQHWPVSSAAATASAAAVTAAAAAVTAAAAAVNDSMEAVLAGVDQTDMATLLGDAYGDGGSDDEDTIMDERMGGGGGGGGGSGGGGRAGYGPSSCDGTASLCDAWAVSPFTFEAPCSSEADGALAGPGAAAGLLPREGSSRGCLAAASAPHSGSSALPWCGLEPSASAAASHAASPAAAAVAAAAAAMTKHTAGLMRGASEAFSSRRSPGGAVPTHMPPTHMEPTHMEPTHMAAPPTHMVPRSMSDGAAIAGHLGGPASLAGSFLQLPLPPPPPAGGGASGGLAAGLVSFAEFAATGGGAHQPWQQLAGGAGTGSGFSVPAFGSAPPAPAEAAAASLPMPYSLPGQPRLSYHQDALIAMQQNRIQQIHAQQLQIQQVHIQATALCGTSAQQQGEVQVPPPRPPWSPQPPPPQPAFQHPPRWSMAGGAWPLPAAPSLPLSLPLPLPPSHPGPAWQDQLGVQQGFEPGSVLFTLRHMASGQATAAGAMASAPAASGTMR
ncbi:hypothetical protein HYH03_017303 [Edaphochlamys debaryana]|uniref:Uncharacterized protein n=1 Tax=Edaphochlamys debaryana TaxID=47281 RepID=A0A836BP16_9CHLO|nr:hypothetical protein HYH03_017303 [Edaphochlamys debaryana]|eukprot:KAG2483851.1 hypothetical protein HYH03_017303 [Edaphochlamys debaryana]